VLLTAFSPSSVMLASTVSSFKTVMTTDSFDFTSVLVGRENGERTQNVSEMQPTNRYFDRQRLEMRSRHHKGMS
jgi:hypothetical protein